jgi:transglutaminase-like putative cysteine protease
MKKNALFIILLIALPIFLFAEKRPKNKMKFGKIPVEQFQINKTDLDSTADAIILGDFHSYSFDYLPSLGLKTNIDIYRRILILNPDGADELATLSISLFQKGGIKDKLSRFKASTYNLTDGEIEETKIDKDSKFSEESVNWETKKYAFNNVKAGSIIEYHYTIISDYYQFPSYRPQGEYPILWSELVFQYYEEIDFKFSYTGNTTPYYRNDEIVNEKKSETWIFKDVAPLKQERFMGPVKNYQTKIDYELNAIEIPGYMYENYATSWQEIARDYMNNEHAGKMIEKSRFFKDIVDYVNADPNATTKEAQVASALSYVRSNYLWNGLNTDYPTYNFGDVIKDKKGNSADLNILLMGSLNSLGIKTRPVLLSTRKNGWLLKTSPSREDLNYVISSYDLDGVRFYIDAATTYSGINALPSKCLNGEALVADKSFAKWVELSPNMKYHRRIFVQETMDEDLVLSGTCQTKEKDYAAQSVRIEINKKGSVEEYIEKQKTGLSEFEISDYEVSNLEKVSEPVNVKFNFTTESFVEEVGDLISIDVILFKDFEENPFKKDYREFAIDFTYPIKLEYTYILSIPEGYTFDELPKPTRVSNADKSISFLMNTSAAGQKATISVQFEIKKSMYTLDQYEDLKTFFDYFVSQQNQPILLKEI